MTIETPFPELRAFDEPPRLPSLDTLLQALPKTKLPNPGVIKDSVVRNLPSFPSGDFAGPHLKKPTAELPPVPAPHLQEGSPFQTPQLPELPPTTPSAVAMAAAQAMEDDEPDATDEELRQAFEPIVESSLERVLYAPDKGLHTYLEPMLRSTVRRAIAEQIDAAIQFRSTTTMDRLGWRMKALLTSRSYDEIVFESTRRYQVEEAYLLRRADFSLVSYASHDPARHAAAKRVDSTVRSLSSKILDADGKFLKSFELRDSRVAIIREGNHTLLVAVVRGRSNALVRADLDYVLRQAEDRFGERLEDETDAFIHVLQPILEGCLLIQSPAPPN